MEITSRNPASLRWETSKSILRSSIRRMTCRPAGVSPRPDLPGRRRPAGSPHSRSCTQAGAQRCIAVNPRGIVPNGFHPLNAQKGIHLPGRRASSASLLVRTMRSQGHSRHSAAASRSIRSVRAAAVSAPGISFQNVSGAAEVHTAKTSPSMFPGAGGPDDAVPAPGAPLPDADGLRHREDRNVRQKSCALLYAPKIPPTRMPR